MRKLVVIVLALLAVPTVASARGIDRGDGTLAVKSATGIVQIANGKGSILGRVDSGTLIVTDVNPFDDKAPVVSGADRPVIGRGVSTTIYQGDGLRFRFVGGRYSIKIVGAGIGLSAVGSGRVRITGEGTLDDGLFALDGLPFRALTTTAFVGVFGTTNAPSPLGG